MNIDLYGFASRVSHVIARLEADIKKDIEGTKQSRTHCNLDSSEIASHFRLTINAKFSGSQRLVEIASFACPTLNRRLMSRNDVRVLNNYTNVKTYAKILFMRRFINLLLILGVFLSCSAKAFCATAWMNDLKTLFLSNNAIIYAVNIRTFNAKDINNDGIIDETAGEERGNFLNAIDRLDELASLGVNTINLLPVTPIGKIKALGTAGSLYAASSFDEINPQLKSTNSDLTALEQMRKFIDECHKRHIRVIVDLPCCGSYDLFLQRPELFKKDKNQNPIIPADWTDVRLLDAGTDTQINTDVYNLYSNFLKMMIDLDVDGIKANVPSLKTASFWKNLIDNTRLRNPEFLFLAEASPANSIPKEYQPTPFNELLEAGFNGYYGGYSDLKNWKTSNELISNIKSNIDLRKKYLGKKSVIGDFATQDQISPILINGAELSKMIIWLNATLPINAYFIDGFSTGDDYVYPLANKKAAKTFTDDEYYFVHRGQLDIFNFSRKPQGNRNDILREFFLANGFRFKAKNLITNGSFSALRTSSSSVFAYMRSLDKESVVVIGNLNFKATQNINISAPKINDKMTSVPIRIKAIPTVTKGKISTTLAPGEVQVIYFTAEEEVK